MFGIIRLGSNLGLGLCFYSRLWVVLFFFCGGELIVGWNNPLPIGQAPGVALGGPEPCLRQGWKKVYPVAGPVWGHSP